MDPTPRTRARRRWAVALLMALLLHLGAIWAVHAWSPVEPAAPAEPEPIEIVFAPDRDEPRQFTEQPKDRAEEPPDDPKYLSNVSAQARDRAPDGADEDPQSEGLVDFPQIEMAEGRPDASPESVPQEEQPWETPREIERPPFEEAEDAVAAAAEPTESTEATTLREQLAASPQSRLHPLGVTDLAQRATNRPQANAPLPGDITLSTQEWEFAPWMEWFRRAVSERWQAPIAAQMGMIGGVVICRIEVSPAGELLALDVLESNVDHVSLEEAVVYALEAIKPYRPLPDHFPDETLGLTARFVYLSGRR